MFTGGRLRIVLLRRHHNQQCQPVNNLLRRYSQRRNGPARERRSLGITGTAAKARGIHPNPARIRVENPSAIIMDGTNSAARRTDAARSDDLLDLVAKDCLLDLSDDLLPIPKAQPEPLWAGDPVRSGNGIRLVNALPASVKGRFIRNPDILGSSPPKELTAARAIPSTRTPLLHPLP